MTSESDSEHESWSCDERANKKEMLRDLKRVSDEVKVLWDLLEQDVTHLMMQDDSLVTILNGEAFCHQSKFIDSKPISRLKSIHFSTSSKAFHPDKPVTRTNRLRDAYPTPEKSRLIVGRKDRKRPDDNFIS